QVVLPCGPGQVPSFARTPDRCILFNSCVTPGACPQFDPQFVPQCDDGYTIVKWAGGEHACATFACDPTFSIASDDANAPDGDALLTDADNGKTVKVKVGNDVVVELGANLTAGYNWEVQQTDKTFGYPETDYFPDGAAVGSGGMTRLTWHTSGPL